jgi:hypothetical protein
MLQENGISICSSGKQWSEIYLSICSIEPGAFTFIVKCTLSVTTMLSILLKSHEQNKIENLSLKTLHLEEVGNFVFKENVGYVSVLKLIF